MKRLILAVATIALLVISVPSFADTLDFHGGGYSSGTQFTVAPDGTVTGSGLLIDGVGYADAKSLPLSATLSFTLASGTGTLKINGSSPGIFSQQDLLTLDVTSYTVMPIGSYSDVLISRGSVTGISSDLLSAIHDSGATDFGFIIASSIASGPLKFSTNDVGLSVPEPASLAMLGPGLLFGIGFLRHRKLIG